MTTENQDQPPGKQNPPSSLPQQEKRWTVEETTMNVSLKNGAGRVMLVGHPRNAIDFHGIADAHNASLELPEVQEDREEEQ